MTRSHPCLKLACAALALVLGACAGTPVAPPPELAVPAHFSTSIVTDSRTAPGATDRWWTLFQDPALEALIETGLRANTQVRQAAARVAQAAALRRATGAERQPSVALQAAASRQGGPLVNAAGDSGSLLRAELQMAWEPDLLARASRTEQAATQDLLSQQAQLAQVQLLVQAEIAQHWLSWRMQQQELQMLQTITDTWREQAEMAARHETAGLGSFEAGARLRAGQAAAQAEQLATERRMAQLQHGLAFLLGRASLPLSTPESAPAIATLPRIPAGLPAQVIARRPDVAAALHALRGEQLRASVAADAWAPALTLTASGGIASSALQSLLAASARGFVLGSLLSLPLFDGERQAARRDAADAQASLATARHAEVVLTALREVEDQLSALDTLAREAQAAQAAQVDLQRLAARAESLHRSGLASRHDVLETQRRVLQNERIRLQVEAARRVATVGLVRALGGGWSTPEQLAQSAPR